MKSFIFALILILAVICLTIVSAAATDEYANRMLSAVADAVDAPADGHDNAAKAIESVWEDARSTVSVTVHRKEATRAETLISALSELCRRPHTDTEYFGICQQLEEQFRHIKEHCAPSWRNIM